MAQLFTSYTIGEIILFLIILAIAIKNLVEFIDWSKKRTKQAVEKDDRPQKLERITQDHDEQLQQIQKELDSLKHSIDLLIESDRDDIKHSITKDHHYFCYKLGSIDDYSLDCIERKYTHYREQGGNSFIEQLMQDLRDLPRKMDTQNR